MKVTTLLFIINLLVFLAEIFLMNVDVINFLSLNSNNIQIHQFITYQFLHNSGPHLFNNLVGLLMFGEHIENFLGRRKFIITYLLCGVIGSIFQLISGFDTILIGASGAIFGLMGFYLMIRKKIKDSNKKLHILLTILSVCFIVTELYNVILGPKTNIGHWTHIGGFVTGILMYLYYEKRNRMEV